MELETVSSASCAQTPWVSEYSICGSGMAVATTACAPGGKSEIVEADLSAPAKHKGSNNNKKRPGKMQSKSVLRMGNSSNSEDPGGKRAAVVRSREAIIHLQLARVNAVPISKIQATERP